MPDTDNIYRLVHAYHQPPFVGEDSARRNGVAAQSWEQARANGHISPLPLALSDMPRFFSDRDRPMVFVKDIINAGCNLCVPGTNDLILLSNADTCFASDLYNRVVVTIDLGKNAALSGPRRDFGFIETPLTIEQIHTGVEYIGTDIFVMRPEWWISHRDRFPDMILGAEMWDHLLRGMMRLEGLPEVSNLVYHEFHNSRWTLQENRNSLPSQIHCQTVGHDWLRRLTPQQRAIVDFEDPAKAQRHRAFTDALARERKT